MMAEVRLVPKVVSKPVNFSMTLAQIRNHETDNTGVGKSVGGAYAFVEPHFEFIHDPLKDWKLINTSPRMWKFEGTVLTLQVSPEVFLPSEYKSNPAVLRAISAHEDLHVQDARAIVQTTLPSKLKMDGTFKEYFIQRAAIPDQNYTNMVCKKMSDYVKDVFAIIWNKKVSDRDTPAKYRSVDEAVGVALRIGYR